MRRLIASLFSGCLLIAGAQAEPPGVSHIFPAGGQRGTKVEVRVGGFYFHGRADFAMEGSGAKADAVVKETDTVWFEGPMILKPESQKKDDYPKDHLGSVTTAPDAPLGQRRWSCRTSQGATPAMKFVVGELPEVIEKEIEGAPIPETVTLPVTINGRIFPREDTDIWRFRAEKGRIITCEVASASLGYPLQAVLEIAGADGRPVPGVRKLAAKGADPAVWFTAPESGEYEVRIHDVGFAGGPNFVYRLTLRSGPAIASVYPLGGRRGETVQLQIAGPGLAARTIPFPLTGATGDSLTRPVEIDGKSAGLVTLHVDDLPEILETEPNDEPSPDVRAVALPAMLNGRIDRPGDIDVWPLELEKAQTVLLEILADKLGSRLDSVLVIVDADGKELARNDDQDATHSDSRLLFTAPKAGRHYAKVSDRFPSRGGPEFAYRLRASIPSASDFDLTLASDFVNVVRQTEAAETTVPDPKKRPQQKGTGLKLDLIAAAAFAKEVVLEVEGLPAGVTVEPAAIPAKQKTVELRFTAPPRTPIQMARLTIRGTAEIDGKKVTREAAVAVPFGEPPVAQVRLAIVPAVPFKHIGQYWVTNDHPGGTALAKHYELDRGGFDGPLTVRLSDRQGRTLQGVTAAPMTVAPGAAQFDYKIQYPPEVELGHTSRVQLMLVGEMTDFDGIRHTISYTSFENENQMISVGSSGLLRISTPVPSLAATPGGRVTVPVSIQRAPAVGKAPVRLQLAVPRHIAGVTAQPATVPAGADKGAITIEFGESPGPFNTPVTILATTTGPDSIDYTGELKIELIAPPKKAAR